MGNMASSGQAQRQFCGKRINSRLRVTLMDLGYELRSHHVSRSGRQPLPETDCSAYEIDILCNVFTYEYAYVFGELIKIPYIHGMMR